MRADEVHALLLLSADSCDGVDGARNGICPKEGRAKMVVVEQPICRSAVHGKVYHRFV